MTVALLTVESLKCGRERRRCAEGSAQEAGVQKASVHGGREANVQERFLSRLPVLSR